MARRKRSLPLLENLRIETAGAQGKALGRVDEKVVFVSGVVPGDLIDAQVTKKRKKYMEARATKIHEYSSDRVDAFCEHFGVCGGCKWQNMSYAKQLEYKEAQVLDQFKRIGHLEFNEYFPIIPADKTDHYRNKLEFTFSNKKWLTIEQIQSEEEIPDRNGLGFHIPGAFDKVVDLNECHLQAEPSNSIRAFIREYTAEHDYSYFDLRAQHGMMRNLIVRSSSTGDLMVIVSFFEDDKVKREALLDALGEAFPQISSMMYVINAKKNDSLFDQDIICYKGKDHIIEKIEDLSFKIGPKSFFQTNTKQAEKLYKAALDFADIQSEDTVYDLYSGTGSITCILAQKAKKVIGVEQVAEAVAAADENAKLNKLDNMLSFVGDTKDVLNKAFFEEHGKPDVIVVDPPRAGLHEKVIQEIMDTQVEKVLYISCNPATQARDLALMKEEYSIEKVQAVDMFPQTYHVENIAFLRRK